MGNLISCNFHGFNSLHFHGVDELVTEKPIFCPLFGQKGGHFGKKGPYFRVF
jgi:hypothetical protein